MIITNNPFKIKINQKIYTKIIRSIGFSSISCPNCAHHRWHFHAYYVRFFDFFNRSVKIRILRVRCSHCGKTHAVLVRDMIPYSLLSHEDIIQALCTDIRDYVQCAHLYFLRSKYNDTDASSYELLCRLNSRNWPVLFLTT